MASAAPFSGLQPAREYGALPGRPRPGDDMGGNVRREDRIDGDDPAPGVRLEDRYRGQRRRPARLGRLTKRRRHHLVRGQVERVDHRLVQRRREPDGGRVEGVIVDHVIPDLLHALIDAGESRLGGRRAGLGGSGGPGSPVERARQRPGIDSGVDHLDPRDLRSRRSVDVHFVPPAGQTAGQIGHEGLRTARLRLADGRHERRHDGDLHGVNLTVQPYGASLTVPALRCQPYRCQPHWASTLKARSRGGLIPSTSKGTRAWPRRRTSSAASG